MTLSPGTQLGSFEVSALIGVGGMGEVYRATDAKLGREVAIKVLPEVFAKDKDRLARFEREAKLLAALNHPNIAGIYDIQQSEATHFLVMELVEGVALNDRLAGGAMPVDEALPLFAQIAEALESAHEHGVIHRDLKPGNIKVTEEGKVKVLDFGLAKAFESQTDSHTGDTMTLQDDASSITGEGEVLGTPAYMSPEQASGRLVDKRADIWAFGCCLYEALTGKRPFNEEITTPDKGDGVIGHVLPSHLPGGKHVLYTAWTGNPSTSFTALLSLETLESTPLITPGMGARYASSGHIVYGHEGALYGVAFDVRNLVVSGTATAMVQDVAWGRGGFQGPQFDISIAGTLAYVRGASSFRQQVLVWVNRAGLAERLPIEPAEFGFPRISPDGQRLAVRVASDEARNIWIYDTSGRAPYPVTFGEVGHVAPIWTPDGRSLIYSSWGSKSVHRVAAAPGNEEPELILRMEDDLGLLMNLVSSTISPDGRIALVTHEDRESGADIWAVPLDGGEAYALIQTPSDEYTGRISPDGKWLAYGSNLTGRREIWVRPFPDPTAGKSLPLTSAGGISPVWSRDGQELFYLENNQQKMMAISVPRAESEDWGRPEELFSTPRVTSHGAGLYAIGFDVAPDGRFIFVIQEGDSLGKDAELAKRPSPEIHIVTNWFEELRRLVPTRGDENN